MKQLRFGATLFGAVILAAAVVSAQAPAAEARAAAKEAARAPGRPSRRRSGSGAAAEPEGIPEGDDAGTDHHHHACVRGRVAGGMRPLPRGRARATCRPTNIAADVKPQKKIARAMLRMVDAINQQIGPAVRPPASAPVTPQEVTCATCHRGKPIPGRDRQSTGPRRSGRRRRAVPAALPPALRRPAAPPTRDHRYQESRYQQLIPDT